MIASAKVERAHEPDFNLGRLTVSPSRREVVRDDGEREVIEHRVMQVLIALSRAEGSIVTRDELILLCWDGRVVGEDSIHRVISRLRKLAMGSSRWLSRLRLSVIGGSETKALRGRWLTVPPIATCSLFRRSH